MTVEHQIVRSGHVIDRPEIVRLAQGRHPAHLTRCLSIGSNVPFAFQHECITGVAESIMNAAKYEEPLNGEQRAGY